MSFAERMALRYPRLFSLREAIGMGLAAIRAYKLRASLTILGVVMGIMTVTGMSSIVAGLNTNMAKMIEGLGSSVIFVRPFKPGEQVPDDEWRKRRGLTDDEVRTIKERCSAVADISPLELVAFDNIKYGNFRLKDARVLGTTQGYSTVHDAFVDKGRFLTDLDVSRRSHVAVIGPEVADALFPYVDPIDKEIQIDTGRYRVIGVMEKKGKFLFENRDNIILLPLGVTGKRDPRFNFLLADVKPTSTAQMELAIDQVRDTLRRERKLRFMQKDNFGIFTQDTLTDLYRSLTQGIYLVMIAISSIGLLVGGVGVMNIMLVSVTERTREIGVRKALGATRRDVRWQFLTEAMTLTGVGGLLGIAVGGLIAFLVNMFSPFPAVVQPAWVAIAFFTSLGTGLTFGLWPAIKAARLDPIEALRYE
jgi:putative ABC transport system permease protein